MNVELPNALYPHSVEPIRIAYTPDGKYLLTVGGDEFVRRYTLDALGEEPKSIDTSSNGTVAGDSLLDGDFADGEVLVDVDVSARHFVASSESGQTRLFDIETMAEVRTLLRGALPARTISFSPDGQWVAVGNDENEAKIVNVSDILRVMTLPDHPAAIKHVSYNRMGTLVATSALDGTIRIFSVALEKPTLMHSINNVTQKPPSTSDTRYTGVSWHSNGESFATVNSANKIQIISGTDFTVSKTIDREHAQGIGALKWSPNGKYLAAGGLDGTLTVWSVNIDDQAIAVSEPVATAKARAAISCIQWHPKKLGLSFSMVDGRMYILAAADLPESIKSTIGGSLPRSIGQSGREDFLDTSAQTSAQNSRPSYLQDMDLEEELIGADAGGAGDVDDESDIDDIDKPLDDWIEDDDGAGYANEPAVNDRAGNKRSADRETNGHFKRPKTAIESIRLHRPFQSGGTPWRDDRRYISMNSLGYVWTVAQDGHNTVTVSFFDRSLHRDYHFKDHDLFHLASLSAEGCLLANDTKMLMRFHEGQNDNWEYTLDAGDKIRAIALSDSMVLLCTERGYIRTFNLFGTALDVHRNSRDPVVTCVAWNHVFMIVRSGYGNRLIYSIEDAKTGRVFQKDDVLDVAHDKRILAVFFSDEGSPTVVDSDGVLLALTHWKKPFQSRWVPLLDCRALARERDRVGIENYWPLGLVGKSFRCIVTKGSDIHPTIPLPIFTEFDINVPVDSLTNERERELLTQRAMLEIKKDLDEDDLDGEITQTELEMDKTLLHLLQLSCKDNKINKSLGIVEMITNMPALEAASKIALRFDMTVLAEKINAVISRRT